MSVYRKIQFLDIYVIFVETMNAHKVIENPTLEEVADLKTAVSEAVTNCIIHGYEGKINKFEMILQYHGNELYVHITDYGIGITDIEKAMEPMYTSKPDHERSGMGFTFMEAFMDEVQVESVPGKGTTVWMKKTTGGEKKEAVWTTQSH